MRSVRFFLLPVALAAVVLLASGCRPGSMLSAVKASQPVITPNGDGVDDTAYINYSLSDDAYVSIFLVDPVGQRYSLHERQPRSAGSYSARFRGSFYVDEARRERKVLADGDYTFYVVAERKNGDVKEEQTGKLTIRDADAQAPEITDVAATYDAISPNGDADADNTVIHYGLSKPAQVTIYALDESGGKYILEAPRDREAALYSHDWNGTHSDRILPDGRYAVHIQAEDKAGNIAEAVKVITIEGSGIPRLEITKVEFTPKTVAVGGELQVKIRVKNTGDAPLKTLGPPPGTAYDTSYNFLHWKQKEPDGSETSLYYERAGVWRVGVNWNQSDRPYPVRWGLTPDLQPLMPGEETVITGTIKVMVNQVREIEFWAGVEQGGVGFPGGQKGLQKIIVNY